MWTKGARDDSPKVIRPAEDWQGKDPPVQEWIVDGLIPARQVTMISGEGGTGKSMMMLQLCACCAVGSWWLGRQTMECPSFYLSCEDDEDTLHQRMSGIVSALGMEMIDMCHLHLLDFVTGGNPIANTWGQHTDWQIEPTKEFVGVYKDAKNAGARLLVLDSRYDVFEGNENNRGTVRGFVRMLSRVARGLDGAVVIIDHPSKDGLKTGDGTSGSTAWHNAVRSRLYVAENKDSGEVELIHKKSNYARKLPPIPIEYRNGAFFSKEEGREWK